MMLSHNLKLILTFTEKYNIRKLFSSNVALADTKMINSNILAKIWAHLCTSKE